MRTPSAVVLEISASLGIDPEEVRDSDITTRTVIRARRLIAYVLRVERGCSWGEVARAVGTTRASAARLCRYAGKNPDPDLVAYLGKEA